MGGEHLLKCRPHPRPPPPPASYFGHAPTLPRGSTPYITIFHLAVGFIGFAQMERKGRDYMDDGNDVTFDWLLL